MSIGEMEFARLTVHGAADIRLAREGAVEALVVLAQELRLEDNDPEILAVRTAIAVLDAIWRDNVSRSMQRDVARMIGESAPGEDA